ncbi:MAG TPA: LLM class flavin-dependent oxidoreductase, partial [Thermomicrobiaceae bacterium]|nr:LLM class flavin-dependent oxidoreductase [Thermomicrobiaceae bacterium]
GPPILVGGSGERVLRLAARYAAAWNADRQNDVANVQALNARVDAACRDVGRDPASLARVIGIQVDLLNETRQAMQPRQWVMAPWPLTGAAEELAVQIRRYQQAAVAHMMVWIDPVSVAGIEAFAPVLEALDAGV